MLTVMLSAPSHPQADPGCYSATSDRQSVHSRWHSSTPRAVRLRRRAPDGPSWRFHPPFEPAARESAREGRGFSVHRIVGRAMKLALLVARSPPVAEWDRGQRGTAKHRRPARAALLPRCSGRVWPVGCDPAGADRCDLRGRYARDGYGRGARRGPSSISVSATRSLVVSFDSRLVDPVSDGSAPPAAGRTAVSSTSTSEPARRSPRRRCSILPSGVTLVDGKASRGAIRLGRARRYDDPKRRLRRSSSTVSACASSYWATDVENACRPAALLAFDRSPRRCRRGRIMRVAVESAGRRSHASARYQSARRPQAVAHLVSDLARVTARRS